MAMVCLMTMIVSVNAHNVHYPTYTEDGITYVKEGLNPTIIDGEQYEYWSVLKIDKPYDRTITIPYMPTVDGKKVVIWGIREKAFETCASLDSLILSDGISLSKSPKALKGCKELEYLYYSTSSSTYLTHEDNGMPVFRCKTLETYVGSPERAFWQSIGGSLENLVIKGGHFFGVFKFCTNLKTIICYSDDAPGVTAPSGYAYSCEDNKFQSWQWETVTLYVPRESLEKYYFDRVWGEIDNIYAIDEMESMTSSVNAVDNNVVENDTWYSLNGEKVDKPNKGVYIKNGKKYIVK